MIIINVSIGLIQEGKAEKAAEAIKGMLSSKATVIRNGERLNIEAVSALPLPKSARLVSGTAPCSAPEGQQD